MSDPKEAEHCKDCSSNYQQSDCPGFDMSIELKLQETINGLIRIYREGTHGELVSAVAKLSFWNGGANE